MVQNIARLPRLNVKCAVLRSCNSLPACIALPCLTIYVLFIKSLKMYRCVRILRGGLALRLRLAHPRCACAAAFSGSQCNPIPSISPHIPTRWFSRAGRLAASSSVDAQPDGEQYEEVEIELPSHCPGCGVRLQLDNQNAPGYEEDPPFHELLKSAWYLQQQWY